MSEAYVVGHITVKNPDMWAEYRGKALASMAEWKAELVFRGKQSEPLAGQLPYEDVVVIRFPNLAAVSSWYASAAYQALIPLRDQAADIVLLSYETL